MGFLGALMPMISSFLQFGQGQAVSDQNYQMQQQNLDYQKDMQRQAWEREDNAVQRRVEDLKKAGLSPVLAAGSAASASAPVSTVAPQRDASFIKDTPSPNAMLLGANNQQSFVESLLKQKAEAKTAELTMLSAKHNLQLAIEAHQPVGTPATIGSLGGTVGGGAALEAKVRAQNLAKSASKGKSSVLDKSAIKQFIDLF